MKKILFVDDELDLQAVVQTRLQAAGYDVCLAVDGEDGLKKAVAEVPDLIITDVLMPGMDGYMFYKELKKKKVTADIPVLVLTSRLKMEDSFKVVGADDFLPKPFETKDLLDRVARLLGASKAIAPVGSSQKKVFLAGVDDEILGTMVGLLKRQGCSLEAVTTGRQVISQAVAFKPDILVIDTQMEDMPTAEIIKVLRQIPEFEKVPIGIYSFYRVSELGNEGVQERALTVDARKADCLDAGASEYLGRFTETGFLRMMAKYLK